MIDRSAKIQPFYTRGDDLLTVHAKFLGYMINSVVQIKCLKIPPISHVPTHHKKLQSSGMLGAFENKTITSPLIVSVIHIHMFYSYWSYTTILALMDI